MKYKVKIISILALTVTVIITAITNGKSQEKINIAFSGDFWYQMKDIASVPPGTIGEGCDQDNYTQYIVNLMKYYKNLGFTHVLCPIFGVIGSLRQDASGLHYNNNWDAGPAADWIKNYKKAADMAGIIAVPQFGIMGHSEDYNSWVDPEMAEVRNYSNLTYIRTDRNANNSIYQFSQPLVKFKINGGNQTWFYIIIAHDNEIPPGLTGNKPAWLESKFTPTHATLKTEQGKYFNLYISNQAYSLLSAH